MRNIQDIISSGSYDIELPSGEFKGPVIIDRPCILKGNSTTLWNNKGSVIEIRSQGVKICGIRAEITDPESESDCICSYYPDTVFENVEISGHIKGVEKEELQWIIPKNLSLGEFKSDNVNTFVFEIYVPAETKISTDISGIKISPSVLYEGRNTVSLTTDRIKNKIFVYGEIILESKFKRRIYVSGKSFSDAPLRQNYMLYKAEEPVPEKNIATDFKNISIPSASAAESKSSEKSGMKQLKKGQRIYIDDIADDVIKIEFNCRQMLSQVDIDPYVFLLNRDNIVPDDEDFVFFSNPVSPDYEVKIQPPSSGSVSDVDIDLRKVPPYIEKISVAYSIYNNNSRDNFSKVVDPFVSIRSRGSIKYFFTAEDLMMETTIIFIEIYRHNMSWKMNMVGSGYNHGLSRLCESYGLMVGY